MSDPKLYDEAANILSKALGVTVKRSDNPLSGMYTFELPAAKDAEEAQKVHAQIKKMFEADGEKSPFHLDATTNKIYIFADRVLEFDKKPGGTLPDPEKPTRVLDRPGEMLDTIKGYSKELTAALKTAPGRKTGTGTPDTKTEKTMPPYDDSYKAQWAEKDEGERGQLTEVYTKELRTLVDDRAAFGTKQRISITEGPDNTIIIRPDLGGALGGPTTDQLVNFQRDLGNLLNKHGKTLGKNAEAQDKMLEIKRDPKGQFISIPAEEVFRFDPTDKSPPEQVSLFAELKKPVKTTRSPGTSFVEEYGITGTMVPVEKNGKLYFTSAMGRSDSLMSPKDSGGWTRDGYRMDRVHTMLKSHEGRSNNPNVENIDLGHGKYLHLIPVPDEMKDNVLASMPPGTGPLHVNANPASEGRLLNWHRGDLYKEGRVDRLGTRFLDTKMPTEPPPAFTVAAIKDIEAGYDPAAVQQKHGASMVQFRQSYLNEVETERKAFSNPAKDAAWANYRTRQKEIGEGGWVNGKFYSGQDFQNAKARAKGGWKMTREEVDAALGYSRPGSGTSFVSTTAPAAPSWPPEDYVKSNLPSTMPKAWRSNAEYNMDMSGDTSWDRASGNLVVTHGRDKDTRVFSSGGESTTLKIMEIDPRIVTDPKTKKPVPDPVTGKEQVERRFAVMVNNGYCDSHNKYYEMSQAELEKAQFLITKKTDVQVYGNPDNKPPVKLNIKPMSSQGTMPEVTFTGVGGEKPLVEVNETLLDEKHKKRLVATVERETTAEINKAEQDAANEKARTARQNAIARRNIARTNLRADIDDAKATATDQISGALGKALKANPMLAFAMPGGRGGPSFNPGYAGMMPFMGGGMGMPGGMGVPGGYGMNPYMMGGMNPNNITGRNIAGVQSMLANLSGGPSAYGFGMPMAALTGRMPPMGAPMFMNPYARYSGGMYSPGAGIGGGYGGGMMPGMPGIPKMPGIPGPLSL